MGRFRGVEEIDVRVSVDTTRTANVDNHSGLLVLDAEVRGCGADEAEWRCIVYGQHGVPLLIRHLCSGSAMRLLGKKVYTEYHSSPSRGPEPPPVL